ncbi:glutamate-5-semialdehyde dehydrogenase [Robiginitomaculum antarcticum]|uniref:glutamate-5-semialdehyde dehydrogenase n=1 Tax=Robiginitomaculum antarcticum TaxID=437507 RepID=UPI00038158B5|nr:glutamate-5-semialdehyde dehydrogenase [Robiginitomaculum antarcticum]
MTLKNTITDLPDYMAKMGRNAARAAKALRLSSGKSRAEAIASMARSIRAQSSAILDANALDMKDGKTKGLSPAMLDRLALTPQRIDNIVNSLDDIAALPDPVGLEDAHYAPPNGLKIARVRVPIGVIGIIYESRPNVTADAGALCVKSGNAAILRAGSESLRSAMALHKAMTAGLKKVDLPETCVQLVATTDRDAVGHLLTGLGGKVDLVIPRGGKSLVARVQKEARIPVLAHLEGICHSYVHGDADIDKARAIVLNAKMRRTGICGATETLLIDASIAPKVLPLIAQDLREAGCELRGCARSRKLVPQMNAATDEDWITEYLDAILAVKVVDNIDGALAHIDAFGSGHTDAIITENEAAAAKFIAGVDSAIAVHNASTQFADGGEFGFGAEIGIATGRLHARGPVGAAQLTTYKYAVRGNGQIRPL